VPPGAGPGYVYDVRAWRVTSPGPVRSGPMTQVAEGAPQPASDELLVRVLACGVCRTDLHVAEGDLPAHREAVVPGHEVVGQVVVPAALSALDRGGTLALAGIHLTDVPPLNYQQHLFQGRQLRGVTSNTRAQAREFLDFAADHRLHVETTEYALAEADRALLDLAEGRVNGAAVLVG
jgi:D-arabinose 1-dehydrogenase-like Zn-dependent alcohol dehydrogenase